MAPVNDYTPLAGYEPEMDMAVREIFFAESITATKVLDGSNDVSSSSRWPGFQFLLIMHDGTRARALSFWRNRRVLDNFIDRHQQANLDYIESTDPENPWLTGVDSRKIGQSDIHLTDATMPASGGSIFSWNPPGAVRICEIENVPDVDRLREWWPMIASPTIPDSLIQVAGFQFFTAVQYPDNCYTTYLGFRSPADLDTYIASDLHQQHEGPFAERHFRNQLNITIHHGELIAWFQRQVP